MKNTASKIFTFYVEGTAYFRAQEQHNKPFIFSTISAQATSMNAKNKLEYINLKSWLHSIKHQQQV